jgi:hypothetical protein
MRFCPYNVVGSINDNNDYLEATDDPEDPEPFGLGADVLPVLQIVPGPDHCIEF